MADKNEEPEEIAALAAERDRASVCVGVRFFREQAQLTSSFFYYETIRC